MVEYSYEDYMKDHVECKRSRAYTEYQSNDEQKKIEFWNLIKNVSDYIDEQYSVKRDKAPGE